MKGRILKSAAALALVLGLGSAARADDCQVTVGLVMELTGPAGEYGQAGAKSVEMAFRDLNDAGSAAYFAGRGKTVVLITKLLPATFHHRVLDSVCSQSGSAHVPHYA